MAAFIITAPIWGYSIVPAAAPAARAVVFDISRSPSRARARPVAHWHRGVDGRLVCRWTVDAEVAPPDD
jgi:hypothetical protein